MACKDLEERKMKTNLLLARSRIKTTKKIVIDYVASSLFFFPISCESTHLCHCYNDGRIRIPVTWS